MQVSRASCRSRWRWIRPSTAGCRAQDRAVEDDHPDAGNRAVNFRGEKRSNATHRSVTRPDCRFVSKGTSGTGAYPGYTVNAVMENRHRFLLGFGVEIFLVDLRSRLSGAAGAGETAAAIPPATLGADKGFFHEDFLEVLLARGIKPASGDPRPQPGPTPACACANAAPPRVSQRCRKLIEELFGEGKDWHGLRRFRRRGLRRVRQETYLIGWVLNLKRLARHLGPPLQPA